MVEKYFLTAMAIIFVSGMVAAGFDTYTERQTISELMQSGVPATQARCAVLGGMACNCQ